MDLALRFTLPCGIEGGERGGIRKKLKKENGWAREVHRGENSQALHRRPEAKANNWAVNHVHFFGYRTLRLTTPKIVSH
jgi:hypothetical protein